MSDTTATVMAQERYFVGENLKNCMENQVMQLLCDFDSGLRA